MQSDRTPVSPPDTPKGLPAIAPPSGKFLAQLFLVPLAIVCGLIAVYYVAQGLFGGFGRTDVRTYLERLKDPNPDIRWRAADDLAQFLHKDLMSDARVASDPRVALDLAELLQEAIRNYDPMERSTREQLAKATEPEAIRERARLLKKLETERSYLEYLTACLGNLLIPAGVPLLSDMALSREGVNEESVLLKRRQAVWALANLGRHLERFTALPPERQEEALARLAEEAGRPGPRGEWAGKASACLAGRGDDKPTALGLDVVFAECAKADNPELRKMAALALMYWEGDAEENERMEQTLLQLAHDDGFGAQENQRMRGLEVRYHAALALARRGSAKVPLHLLQQMLSEEQLAKDLRLRNKDGRDVPDREAAQATLANALKAITELHRRQPDRDLSALRPALRQLTQSPQAALRVEAERVLQLVSKR